MFSKIVFTLSICLVCSQCSVQPEPHPKVTAPSGVYEGSFLTSRQGRQIYTFRGIRYAEAPIGELRFKVSLTFSD